VAAERDIVEEQSFLDRAYDALEWMRVEARKMLEEIHESELKQIFGESDLPRRRYGRREPETPEEISADLVMRDLDRDLRLGIFAPGGEENGAAGSGSASAAPSLSLFKDRATMEAFGERMDRDFAHSPPAERIDLGIAFLEMSLYDLAARHFEAVVHALTLEQEEGGAPDPLIAATGLLAYARILAGRGFEATLALQQVLNDAEVEELRKLDLIYLMGRAYEGMGKANEARQWYQKAGELEPHYRDTDERLRRMARK
jgi:tetratricopeptide (TPR) repeat protein